jgi:hypothetical protein
MKEKKFLGLNGRQGQNGTLFFSATDGLNLFKNTLV